MQVCRSSLWSSSSYAVVMTFSHCSGSCLPSSLFYFGGLNFSVLGTQVQSGKRPWLCGRALRRFPSLIPSIPTERGKFTLVFKNNHMYKIVVQAAVLQPASTQATISQWKWLRFWPKPQNLPEALGLSTLKQWMFLLLREMSKSINKALLLSGQRPASPAS